MIGANLPPVARLIPERIDGTKRLGRHVEHDPRSRAFVHPEPGDILGIDMQGTTIAEAVQTLDDWLSRVMGPALASKCWPFHGEILNQGGVGSCTGEAITNALNCEPFQNLVTSRVLTQDDALSMYEQATTLDTIPGTYPPDDTGSSGLAVCKAARARGLIKGYRHAVTLASLLHWLATRGPAIIGIEWFEGFDTPEGPDAELVSSGAVRGGHEVCIHEIDVENRRVRGIQSWGPEWGDHGFFVISWDTLSQLLARQGDATLPVAP